MVQSEQTEPPPAVFLISDASCRFPPRRNHSLKVVSCYWRSRTQMQNVRVKHQPLKLPSWWFLLFNKQRLVFLTVISSSSSFLSFPFLSFPFLSFPFLSFLFLSLLPSVSLHNVWVISLFLSSFLSFLRMCTSCVTSVCSSSFVVSRRRTSWGWHQPSTSTSSPPW